MFSFRVKTYNTSKWGIERIFSDLTRIDLGRVSIIIHYKAMWG